jgi:hypothetical protein
MEHKLMASVEDQMYENKRVQTYTRFGIFIAIIVVGGMLGALRMCYARPIPPPTAPLISAEACGQMCPTGVAEYNHEGCTCNHPQVNAVQVDKMDCNCACVPMNRGQETQSSNKNQPLQLNQQK